MSCREAIYIEPIFEKNDFWELVAKYEGKITSVKFELISPNMANISKALSIDLRGINRATNNHKTNLELKSDKESSLTIPRDNPQINEVVDYASEGGGKISMRARGVTKTITTAESIIEYKIDDLNVSAGTPQEIASAVKGLLE